MKILIVDNNLHIQLYPQSFLVRSCLGARCLGNVKISRPTELSDRDICVDRVILTGSTSFMRQEKGWMKKEREFIEKWMDRGVPILGICFGAQLLVRHIFGKEAIVALPFPINGSVLVEHEKDSPLFKGVPNPFGAVSIHYEGVVVPEKYVIAKMPDWPCYGFAYPGNVYGIQFHPELSGNLGRLLVRLQRYLYDRNVYQDFSVKTSTGYGNRIVKNFITSSL